MKKCPYCKTLMNDDVNMCPNCLKDMSNLTSMPEVKVLTKRKTLNYIIYGGILAIGGVVAGLSQGINKKGFQVKYDEILTEINMVSSEEAKKELIAEASEYLALINNCSFREVFFFIIAGIGLIVAGVAIVLALKNKFKKKEK